MSATDDFDLDDGGGIDIAVVGLAGRFPGADDVDALWRLVRDGVEAVSAFTDEQLRQQGIAQSALDDPAYVKAGVLFDGFDQFDAAFFGYTPREAEQLDPQQRIFLECAWQALEHAGYDAERFKGAVGVYGGAGANLYLMRHLLPRQGWDAGVAELIGLLNGNSTDSLSTRVAYKLNLRGPAVTVQTACSTSLAAVHMACQALLSHECDMALAGGVWLNLLQNGGYRHQPGAILSSDGHCRAFDAKADGTVLGSGAGIVVLKRLDEALRDGDTVHAIVKGSAANNDGANKVGYTAPSVDGQADVIRAAQTIAGVEPDTIGYVEAHGTGTTLGDPIEMAALTQAFGSGGSRTSRCAIGSVKTNLGHLDAAAGVTGLIKAVMALKHRTLPPSLNFESPNPRIDFEQSPFYVNTQAKDWPAGETPRRAGVSSFGMGGTNVHVVMEEAPSPKPLSGDRVKKAAHLLRLSARSEAAVEARADQLAAHLAVHPDASLDDVAFTLKVGRKRFAHRAVAVVHDAPQGEKVLKARLAPQYFSGKVLSDRPSVAFLFPGQGAQHVGMARALYEGEAVFRDTVDQCCTLLRERQGLDLLALIYPLGASEDHAWRLAQTAVTQPALFVIEYAMARWWMSQGLRPDAMLGHSIGEYVAACLAGVFSLEDALALVAMRGQLLQSTQAGAMLAVALPEDALRAHLAAGCDLAAVNAAQSCVLSGGIEAIERAERTLAAEGAEVRRLQVSHAFHSALLEPVLGDFEAQVRRINLSAPTVPFVSNVSGDWITAQEACDPAYWVRHLRGTVRFAQGLDTLLDKADRIVLEVGPGETLCGLVKRHPKLGARPVLSSQTYPNRLVLNEDQPARCVAQLWVAGVELEGAVEATPSVPLRRVALPAYPFERQSYWVAAARGQDAQPTPADDRAHEVDDWFHAPTWRRTELPMPGERATAGTCTVVLGEASGFSARLADVLVQDGGAKVIRITPGQGPARLDARHHVARLDEAPDLAAVLAAIADEVGPVERIAHLWGLGDGEGTPEDLQRRGFFSLLALAQAIEATPAAKAAQGLALTVVTDGLADVLGTEPLNPHKATLQGPCTVVPQEMPGLSCRLVDVVLPTAGSLDERRLAEQLSAEMLSEAGDALLAWRGAHRWVQGHEAVRRDAPGGQRLRHGGVYLITGGLGGVGLALASHLARTRQARLVLLGRSELPDPFIWAEAAESDETPTKLRALLRSLLDVRAQGGEVLVVQADVGDEQQVRHAIGQARARFGEIHGIIHAAGQAGGGLIANKAREDVERVFRPKLEGSLNLLKAVEGQPLDFVLLCSSVTAVFGGVGQVDYAAANSFQDALATLAGRTPGCVVTSVNWDTWRDTGMAANLALPTQVGMSAVQGAAVLERLLGASDAVRTLVCTSSLKDRPRLLAELAGSLGPQLGKASSAREMHPRPAHLATDHVAPVGQAEITLASIWSELLGIAPIGSLDNFFEMGGDSLLAVQLVSRIRAAFGVEVSVKSVFASPVMGQLAGVLERLRQPSAAAAGFAVTARPADQRIPLSYAQQRLWFLWKLDPDSAAFNVNKAFRLRGALNLVAMSAAFDHLVSRHAVLRTVLREEDGLGWQVIQPARPLALPLIDLSGPADESVERVQAHVEARSCAPFDLSSGPMLRPEVIRLADDEYILLLVMHHVITDGWSVGLMMSEFVQAYEASLKGQVLFEPAPALQYADFAVAQRQWLEAGAMQRQADHWKQRLAGIEPLVIAPDLPLAGERRYPGAVLAFSIGPALSASVRAVAQRHSATPFMLLLSALSVVLSERSGQKRFHVGTDMANRNTRETESMVGFFINQIALPIDCAEPRSMTQLLAQLRQTVIESADHQDLPFDRLVETLRQGRRGGRAPLFQVKVVHQEDEESAFALPGLAVSRYPLAHHDAELDLLFSLLSTTDEVRVEVKYDRELYAPSTIDAIRTEWLATLQAWTSQPGLALDSWRAELNTLRQAERELQDGERAQRLARLRTGLKPRQAWPPLLHRSRSIV